jgi:hypothetical protein
MPAWWSTNNNKQNMKMLDSLDVHNRAAMVPICYEFHYNNNAWKTSGGGKYSQEPFI